MTREEPRWPKVPMTTEDAGEIIDLAALYCRNQWDLGAGSQESREVLLEAAWVLLADGIDEMADAVWRAIDKQMVGPRPRLSQVRAALRVALKQAASHVRT